MPLRLAAIVSHPIQYQAPLFRRVAATPGVDFHAFFLSDHGVQPTFDEGFGRAVKFDVPLLEGYRSSFVRNRSPRPTVATPLGLVNPGLARELALGRFDAVWVHGYAHASEWIAYATAAATRTPWMMRGESTNLYDTPPARRAVKKAVLGPLVKGAGALLYIGRQNREFYESLGGRPDQFFFAPYSVENAYFARRAEEARTSGKAQAIRDGLGASADDVVLLFCGKLLARKRPMDLVDALARLGDDGKRAIAAFIGEGEIRAELEAAIAKSGLRAKIVGFVNQSELPAWYAASDLFVLPSDHETWGLVVNEAMAAGLPAVASRMVGCSYDLIEGKGTGAVHEACDPASLAEALRPLIVNPERRKSAADKARGVIAQYDVSVTAQGVVDALDAVAGRRGRHR